MKKESKYPVLVAEAARSGVLMKEIADTGGMTTRALHKKLYESPKFTDDEAFRIWKAHFPKQDRNNLFRLEEHTNEPACRLL